MNLLIKEKTKKIDRLVTHKVWGVPIFLLLLLFIFNVSFTLGTYPMMWLQSLLNQLSQLLHQHIPDGAFKSMLIDGAVNGAGGLLVFIPNIVLLNTFISLMEDSGYMARVVILLDKMMHKIGLHGESFVSLVMGFGCNVPAITSTSGVSSRGSRIIAMLIIPLMSCSARLPVYITIATIFFPDSTGTVLFSLYMLGVLMAVVMAKIFKLFLFDEEDIPFVQELPIYHFPSLKQTAEHVWSKTEHYLRSIFGVIMVASILLWGLSYYPRPTEDMTPAQQKEASYIGQVGKFIEPALAPLGFNWQSSIALLSGVAGKEIIVSSLMVLYDDKMDNVGGTNLAQRIQYVDPTTQQPPLTPLSAYSFLVFVLLYFPCVATLTAISRETGSWKWGAFALFYTTALAWLFSFAIYQIGSLFL